MAETTSQPVPVVIRVMDRVQRAMELVLFALMAIMVIIVFINVVLRFVFSSGIAQTEELSRYAFVWLTYLGAVVLLREGGHLGMDSFLIRLSPMGQRICKVASDLLIIFCCVLLVIGSWYLTKSSAGEYSQAARFPMVLLFGVGMVTGVAMILIVAVDVWLAATGRMELTLHTSAAHVD